MQKRTSKDNEKTTELDEPMGIIIAHGSRNEDAARFSAYVWGPVPGSEAVGDLIAVA